MSNILKNSDVFFYPQTLLLVDSYPNFLVPYTTLHWGWMPPALGLFLFLIRSAGRLSIVHVDILLPAGKLIFQSLLPWGMRVSLHSGQTWVSEELCCGGGRHRTLVRLLPDTWLLAFWQIARPSLRLEISVIRRRIISCRSPNALPCLPTPQLLWEKKNLQFIMAV